MSSLYNRFEKRFDFKITKVRDFYEFYNNLSSVDVYSFLNYEENELKEDCKFHMTMNVIITAIIFFVLGWIASVYVFS